MKTLKSVMFDFFGGRDISGRFTSGMDFGDGELRDWDIKKFDTFLNEIINLIVTRQLRPNTFNAEDEEFQIYYTNTKKIEDEIMITIPSTFEYIQLQHFNDTYGLIIHHEEGE